VFSQLSLKWVQAKGYQDWMVGTGFVIGVVSGCLCFMCLMTIGVTKQIFNRIRSRIANPFLQEVLPPLIGGITIGAYCASSLHFAQKSLFVCKVHSSVHINYTNPRVVRMYRRG
jgi:hypothetical protein